MNQITIANALPPSSPVGGSTIHDKSNRHVPNGQGRTMSGSHRIPACRLAPFFLLAATPRRMGSGVDGTPATHIIVRFLPQRQQ